MGLLLREGADVLEGDEGAAGPAEDREAGALCVLDEELDVLARDEVDEVRGEVDDDGGVRGRGDVVVGRDAAPARRA